ncbi:MAG TPA: hypothetical protein VFT26_01745 [Pyrinomonadaceae bacterium]|nr:hypothetical protein [Pyrinomonadaceae bacterium]
MKQETNNEMDLLLRRLGRRDDAVVSGGADGHLDADELSAYAENALPVAARSRYTMHLAECSHCRNLVVQLSSSAGVVATTENAAVAGPSGLKKFLASLFTPMVLRYAVPALGLVVVAAIGFVVLRRERPSEYVVQDYGNATKAAPSPTDQPVFGYDDRASKTAPSEAARVEKQTKDQAAQPAPPPNTPPSVTSIEADVSKDKAAQPKPEEQAPVVAHEPPKPEPTATPQTRVETEVSKNEVKELPAKSPPADKALRGAQREDRKTDTDFARGRRTDSVTAAAAPATGSAGGAVNMQRDGVDSNANTRSVAGRRFRKQGGVWIDTAYDSSKDAVTLSRGSEQYRALVADEPAIKTIADTLDGEIIVVWKGRTYRIR